MTKVIDLVGQTYGRLTVQELEGRDKHRNSIWKCVCECGNTAKVYGGALKSGHTRSCGCYNKEQVKKANTKHGHKKDKAVSREYNCWQQMVQRCVNPNNPRYKDYGGRGIKVCDRWLKSFENFYTDMGECPPSMTLDRKDNDGNYTPDNCGWATQEEQNNNRKSNVWKEYKSDRKTLAQWGRSLGLGRGCLWDRLNKLGWSIERALITPARGIKMKLCSLAAKEILDNNGRLRKSYWRKNDWMIIDGYWFFRTTNVFTSKSAERFTRDGVKYQLYHISYISMYESDFEEVEKKSNAGFGLEF